VASLYQTLMTRVPRPDPHPSAKKKKKPGITQAMNVVGRTFGGAPAPPPIPPGNPGYIPPAAPPVTNNAPSPPATNPLAPAPAPPPPVVGFNEWKLGQQDYTVNAAALNERRKLLFQMLGSVTDDPNSMTKFGQLNRQFNQDIAGSRQGAANAGFFRGGALDALKEGDVADLARNRFAAESEHQAQVTDLDTQLANLEAGMSSRYNQWVKDNAPVAAIPPSAEPGTFDPDNPQTPEQSVVAVKWDEDAQNFYNTSMKKMPNNPLQTVKAITAYLGDNQKFISTSTKRSLLALRDAAYARYYQMTRGGK